MLALSDPRFPGMVLKQRVRGAWQGRNRPDQLWQCRYHCQRGSGAFRFPSRSQSASVDANAGRLVPPSHLPLSSVLLPRAGVLLGLGRCCRGRHPINAPPLITFCVFLRRMQAAVIKLPVPGPLLQGTFSLVVTHISDMNGHRMIEPPVACTCRFVPE